MTELVRVQQTQNQPTRQKPNQTMWQKPKRSTPQTREWTEYQMQKAIKNFKRHDYTVYRTSKLWDVPYATFHRRLRGSRARHEYHQDSRMLTKNLENVLEEWVFGRRVPVFLSLATKSWRRPTKWSERLVVTPLFRLVGSTVSFDESPIYTTNKLQRWLKIVFTAWFLKFVSCTKTSKNTKITPTASSGTWTSRVWQRQRQPPNGPLADGVRVESSPVNLLLGDGPIFSSVPMLQAIKALSPDHKLLNRLSRWTWSCRNFGGARHQRQWPKIRVLYLEEHWEVQLGHSTQAQLEALDFRGLMVILVEDAEWSELWLKYCTSLTHDFWQTEVITKVIAVRTGPCGPTTCHWVQRGGGVNFAQNVNPSAPERFSRALTNPKSA